MLCHIWHWLCQCQIYHPRIWFMFFCQYFLAANFVFLCFWRNFFWFLRFRRNFFFFFFAKTFYVLVWNFFFDKPFFYVFDETFFLRFWRNFFCLRFWRNSLFFRYCWNFLFCQNIFYLAKHHLANFIRPTSFGETSFGDFISRNFIWPRLVTPILSLALPGSTLAMPVALICSNGLTDKQTNKNTNKKTHTCSIIF